MTAKDKQRRECVHYRQRWCMLDDSIVEAWWTTGQRANIMEYNTTLHQMNETINMFKKFIRHSEPIDRELGRVTEWQKELNKTIKLKIFYLSSRKAKVKPI